MKDFNCNTLGTGLGAGIVSNGTSEWSEWFAGELWTYDSNLWNGTFCGCGKEVV